MPQSYRIGPLDNRLSHRGAALPRTALRPHVTRTTAY